MLIRDIWLVIALWFGSPLTTIAEPAPLITCSGQAVQAGLLLCKAPAGETLIVSGPNGEARRSIPINDAGIATIGLLRNEPLSLKIALQAVNSASIERELTASPMSIDVQLDERSDPFRTIEGLDCDKVDARTPEQIEHAGQSWVKKQDAFKTFEQGPGAAEGFRLPADGPMSSPFGPARKYIGVGVDGEPCEKTSVHYGYDMAIPIGTEIVAPAAGTVTLGDPDLYYEGGTVFLDHGEGLVSVFMHLSEVDVVPGQSVETGARLGASGNTGRTTGPHLHWAVKWRNPSSEDRGKDFYIDPALLLELEAVLQGSLALTRREKRFRSREGKVRIIRRHLNNCRLKPIKYFTGTIAIAPLILSACLYPQTTVNYEGLGDSALSLKVKPWISALLPESVHGYYSHNFDRGIEDFSVDQCPRLNLSCLEAIGYDCGSVDKLECRYFGFIQSGRVVTSVDGESPEIGDFVRGVLIKLTEDERQPLVSHSVVLGPFDGMGPLEADLGEGVHK